MLMTVYMVRTEEGKQFGRNFRSFLGFAWQRDGTFCQRHLTLIVSSLQTFCAHRGGEVPAAQGRKSADACEASIMC